MVLEKKEISTLDIDIDKKTLDFLKEKIEPHTISILLESPKEKIYDFILTLDMNKKKIQLLLQDTNVAFNVSSFNEISETNKNILKTFFIEIFKLLIKNYEDNKNKYDERDLSPMLGFIILNHLINKEGVSYSRNERRENENIHIGIDNKKPYSFDDFKYSVEKLLVQKK